MAPCGAAGSPLSFTQTRNSNSQVRNGTWHPSLQCLLKPCYSDTSPSLSLQLGISMGNSLACL